MLFLNKLFGPSKIQEEFQKSIVLKIPLLIYGIDKIEYTIKGKQIVEKDPHTAIFLILDQVK